MKHTIYLTSGQIAEVITDGMDMGIDDGQYFNFNYRGRNIASFRKEFVAGVSSTETYQDRCYVELEKQLKYGAPAQHPWIK